MLSPQLAVLLQMWWREGERRSLMLPAPDAPRSGRYCGFVTHTARIVVSTRSLKLDRRAKPTRLVASAECARPRATSEGGGQGERDSAAADLQM